MLNKAYTDRVTVDGHSIIVAPPHSHPYKIEACASNDLGYCVYSQRLGRHLVHKGSSESRIVSIARDFLKREALAGRRYSNVKDVTRAIRLLTKDRHAYDYVAEEATESFIESELSLSRDVTHVVGRSLCVIKKRPTRQRDASVFIFSAETHMSTRVERGELSTPPFVKREHSQAYMRLVIEKVGMLGQPLSLAYSR